MSLLGIFFFWALGRPEFIIFSAFRFSGGCATFPSICQDKHEIEKLDKEIKELRIKYDRRYLENKKAYLDLRTANTDNAYIMYYINETIQAVQSLEEYQDKIAKTLEIELNELYQRFQANPNSTVYLASLIGELEYRLSDIRNMIASQKNNQIIGLALQYLIEFSLSRFVKAYSRAYSQILTTEDIYATTVWTALFTADATDAGILLDPNHPRFEEVMARHGVPTSDRVTLKQKFKYTPKVFKQMWTNMKNKFKDLGTSLRKWKRIRNWQGFKGKLRHSLRGPAKKVNNVKKFASSKATRKLFVRNYKLSWSQRGMMAIGIIGDAISIAVQTYEWKKVADEMKKARGKYEEYRNNLKNELQSITDQTKEIADHWPEIIDAFKELSLSFKSLIDNVTQYEDFSDVLGLPKLPVDISSPLFSVDFNAVTKHNILSAQQAVKGFMQEVDNDITRVADQMRARTILYDNVLKMTADKRAVQYMLDASHNVFKFSSSQTIKNFGEDLSKKDIVCTVSQLRKTRTQYDYYHLEPFRPRCDVNTTEFSNYETQARLLRRERIMTSTISDYRGNFLSTLVDLIHAAYRASTDEDLRRFGSKITDQLVICTVSKVFRNKQKFDFISLSPFRPDCSSVTVEDFQKMKAAANKIRVASAAVEGAMTTCRQFNFCPCPALIAQMNGISEADVIELIKALRPNQSRYCGTTGCDCIVL